MIRVFCLVLVGIFRPKQSKLLFHSVPDAADNSWHFFVYLCKHLAHAHLIWVCDDPALVKRRIFSQSTSPDVRVSVVKNRSLSALFHYCSSGYIFLSHGLPSYLPAKNRATTVNLWHGMPIKPIQFLDKSRGSRFVPYSYVLSTSEFFTRIMAECFKVSEEQVLATGLPRNDVLLERNRDLEVAFKASLHIPDVRRLVFWLPTFRRAWAGRTPDDASVNSFLDEWSEGFWDRLSSAAVSNNCVVIIKLHPLDILNREPPLLRELPGIRLVSQREWDCTGIDLYDALAASSALITDLSSVLVDYGVTGNPIAVTYRSLELYLRGTIAGCGALLASCCKIDDEVSFIKFLEKSAQQKRVGLDLAEYNLQAKTRHSACQSLARSLQLA